MVINSVDVISEINSVEHRQNRPVKSAIYEYHKMRINNQVPTIHSSIPNLESNGKEELQLEELVSNLESLLKAPENDLNGPSRKNSKLYSEGRELYELLSSQTYISGNTATSTKNLNEKVFNTYDTNHSKGLSDEELGKLLDDRILGTYLFESTLSQNPTEEAYAQIIKTPMEHDKTEEIKVLAGQVIIKRPPEEVAKLLSHPRATTANLVGESERIENEDFIYVNPDYEQAAINNQPYSTIPESMEFDRITRATTKPVKKAFVTVYGPKTNVTGTSIIKDDVSGETIVYKRLVSRGAPDEYCNESLPQEKRCSKEGIKEYKNVWIIKGDGNNNTILTSQTYLKVEGKLINDMAMRKASGAMKEALKNTKNLVENQIAHADKIKTLDSFIGGETRTDLKLV